VALIFTKVLKYRLEFLAALMIRVNTATIYGNEISLKKKQEIKKQRLLKLSIMK
jgi:hypothetical protein